MILVLSGEGPTDIGSCTNAQGQCSGKDFRVGPMALLVDQLLEIYMGYSIYDLPERIHFISESELSRIAKSLPRRLHPTRGKKKEAEMGYFFTNAAALGNIAKHIEGARQDQAIAVLFRDCDGTRSAKSGLWQMKWQSMENGFAYANFSCGVPMLPKPKSEAWLLCAAKTPPYEKCDDLESLSGNDQSPNAAKGLLVNALGCHLSSDELCDWLQKYRFDIERAKTMQSFRAFSDRLNAVALSLLRSSYTG